MTPVLTNGMPCPATPRLDDLTFLGLKDYVGQCLFIGKDDRPGARGPGAYRLTAAGYTGRGTWDVRANPGRLRSDDGSLKWEVEVLGGSDPSEPRRAGMVATREGADMIDAECEAEVRAQPRAPAEG